NRAILTRMIAVPDERRTARFRCLMCLIDPAGTEAIFEGICEGKIAHHARGVLGFGYDPIFIPEGHSKTFAELGIEVKNRISHRARALQQLIAHLQSRIQGPKRL
ncbi:MAG: non-canonical purine NTP pyrophosphatase, partial [candidate division WOR-3 bacterium]